MAVDFDTYSISGTLPTFADYDANWTAAKNAINGGTSTLEQKTSDFEVSSSVKFYEVDTGTGAVAVTLPAAASGNSGDVYVFIKRDSRNAITFSQDINGDASYSMSADYEVLRIVSTGTDWIKW